MVTTTGTFTLTFLFLQFKHTGESTGGDVGGLVGGQVGGQVGGHTTGQNGDIGIGLRIMVLILSTDKGGHI